MAIIVLDKAYNKVDEIEIFPSLVWNDRYSDVGEFELVINPSKEDLTYIVDGNYIQYSLSDKTMIIDSIGSDYDPEKGYTIPVKGGSLESLLKRRVIWPMLTITGNLQEGVKKILDLNVINPVDVNRKISNFVFKYSTDPAITSLVVSTQFTGDSVFDAIKTICDATKLGFKVILNDLNQFEFQLYKGKDRSGSQDILPYVTFSPSFKNLKSSKYYYSTKDYKNVAYVAGEGEGADRKYTILGTGSGLDRREVFVDARDISSDSGETTIPLADYIKLLTNRGTEELAKVPIIAAFEGEIYNSLTYTYGEDFFIGDIVELENGFSVRTRITEMVITFDGGGIMMTPTFIKEE